MAKTLEEYQKYIQDKLESLRPIFAKAVVGDFSQDIPDIEKDDEFAELFFGIQAMLEVIREKVAGLEMEIGQRHEAEQRLIVKNKEQTQAQKAMLNVLDDLQKTKSEVEQEGAKYEALINSIGEGVVATDTRGIIIFMNTIAEQIGGLSGKECIGHKLTECLRAEDEKGNPISQEKRMLSSVLITGKSLSSSEYYYVRMNGTKFPVSVTVSPVLFGRKIVGAINVFRDISYEKELDRAKSEFISVASHQLRTPVTALKWLAEITSPAVNKLDEKDKEYFRDLSFSIERLSKLVEDLLNVSRIELGTRREEKTNIDLVKFIGDYITDIKQYADSKEHQIVIKNKVPKAHVNMDSKMLYNVLQNLVSNAIEYSPPGTTVTLEVNIEDGHAKASVSNQGSVIPPDEQKKLFQRFYRGESTKKFKTDGTGLGLYIVKANVENAGGAVGFRSEKDVETVFWFSLPLIK